MVFCGPVFGVFHPRCNALGAGVLGAGSGVPDGRAGWCNFRLENVSLSLGDCVHAGEPDRPSGTNIKIEKRSGFFSLELSFYSFVYGTLCVDNTHQHSFTCWRSPRSTRALATDRDLMVTTISMVGARKEPFHMVAELLALRASQSHGSDPTAESNVAGSS